MYYLIPNFTGQFDKGCLTRGGKRRVMVHNQHGVIDSSSLNCSEITLVCMYEINDLRTTFTHTLYEDKEDKVEEPV